MNNSLLNEKRGTFPGVSWSGNKMSDILVKCDILRFGTGLGVFFSRLGHLAQVDYKFGERL
jgi:hypothetical protein